MNLLFLDSIEANTYGGMEEWIRLVAHGLSQRGHHITLVGRPRSEFLRRATAGAGQIETVELKVSGDFHPVTVVRLARMVRARAIDAVVCNFNKDIRLAGLARSIGGRHRVIWSAGLDITKNTVVHRWLTPRLIDRVFVPSQSLKNQITRHGYIMPETVDVIPIGIDDLNGSLRNGVAYRNLRSRYNLRTDAVVGVTVARLVEQKGHRFLIDALPAIVAAQPLFKLLLLGSGPLEQALRERAEALRMLDHLIFAGMLDSVSETLAGCDLMIHPSIDEPFGIALLEGMRAGIPIVASDVGGIPEVVGECGLLVPPRNSKELAAVVISLLNAPARRTELANRGRERFMKQFGAGLMTDRVEEALKAVVGQL
ncbi:MAG: glycosyltransferase family 4 protein [Candidatus Zixiibacteriota bacterium]